MNEFNGFPKQTIGGYHAMIRKAQDASAKPVLGEGGNPEVFPTEAEAWAAVTKHLLAYFNGALRRDGIKVEARSKAEMLFRRGKAIPVEYKGGVTA